VKLLVMQFSPIFISLRTKYSPQHPVLTLSLCSSLNIRDHKTLDNDQKVNRCINVLSSQTFRSYLGGTCCLHLQGGTVRSGVRTWEEATGTHSVSKPTGTSGPKEGCKQKGGRGINHLKKKSGHQTKKADKMK
jgi:hypothetical protein